MDIKTITVIGANGTMGYNIAGIFAAFGECKVFMVCRNLDSARQAKKKAMLSVKGEAIEKYLIPADYCMLQECIDESDLIMESVAENFQLKTEINKKIDCMIRKNQIICTGTSGLSIEKLSEFFSPTNQKHYLGVHFFNPPYNMVLCEVIPGKYTNRKIVEEVKKYAHDKLRRTIVEVKDSPAFLGNRIGFQFINEAIQTAEKYKYNGGIDYIDAILGPFTGRNMAPITTADFVGLDVHKAIVDNLYTSTQDYANATFQLPNFVNKIIDAGNLGRKSHKGLYQTIIRDDGTKRLYVYDILTDSYREKYDYKFPFVEKMIENLKIGDYQKALDSLIENQSLEARLCVEFLLKYALYSLVATNLVGDTIADADSVMADGFGWVPPLALIHALGGTDTFYKLCRERLGEAYFSKAEPGTLPKRTADIKI